MYKIIIQKPVVLLYTESEYADTGIRKASPFTKTKKKDRISLRGFTKKPFKHRRDKDSRRWKSSPLFMD